MTRLPAVDRVRRMLAIVPWVAAQADGVAIDELCERFDIDRRQLVEDLSTLSFVGVAPYTPDLLVEVVVEEDRVFITLPVAFDRPFRLTPDEGLALLAAGASLLSVPGADPDGPLARALARMAGLLGVQPEQLDVELGQAEGTTLAVLGDAIAARRQLELDYYSYGRDDHARRVVDPYRLFSDTGQWYLSAWCHLADAERLFRVDRIASATLLDSGYPPPTAPVSLGVFQARPDDPRIVLELEPDARWVVEQYPVEATEELEGGRCRVTLAVTGRPWLERLLLRLGPDATVVDADGDLAGVGPAAAARVLARYDAGGG